MMKNGELNSIPVHPNAGIAQLVRVSVCQSESCGFESHYPLKLFKILNPVVVPVLGMFTGRHT